MDEIETGKNKKMANEQLIIENTKPKTGLVEFAQETKREIEKVTWPTRAEIVRTTFMIVLFAMIAGLFFLAVDTSLGYVVSKILGMS